MERQSVMPTTKPRQFLTRSLLLLGLGLFLVVGNRAVAVINDRDFLEGRPRLSIQR